MYICNIHIYICMYDWLTDVNRLCEIIFIQMVIQIGPMISVDCHLFLLCSSEEVVLFLRGLMFISKDL